LHRRHEAVEFLASDYKGGAVQRMWEVVDLVRKLLLSSAVLFVPEGSIERIAIALFISGTFQVLQAYYQPYNSRHKNLMADGAGAALSLTYFLTLLVKAFPVAKDKGALGALLLLLLVFVALACAVALVAMRRQTAWLLRKKRASSSAVALVELGELPSSSETTPRANEAGEGSTVSGVAEHAHGPEELGASELRVVELQAEMASMKREHAKYTSARIVAEREKAQAHAAEVEAAAKALQVSQVERERASEEAATLRAELVQLKKNDETTAIRSRSI